MKPDEVDIARESVRQNILALQAQGVPRMRITTRYPGPCGRPGCYAAEWHDHTDPPREERDWEAAYVSCDHTTPFKRLFGRVLRLFGIRLLSICQLGEFQRYILRRSPPDEMRPDAAWATAYLRLNDTRWFVRRLSENDRPV
jgi:hypothetical protein